jgi:hypothetical protein
MAGRVLWANANSQESQVGSAHRNFCEGYIIRKNRLAEGQLRYLRIA